MQLASGKEFFQLRGACTDHYPVTQSPVAGCYHLGFFPGRFDIANKTVSFDLPFNARDSVGRLVAPDFKPGAVLLENQSAGMSIAAAFQAVVGNTNTSDFINGWNPYFVGPGVQLGVGPAGADLSDPEAVTFTQNATLNPDGTFTGSVSGLTSSNNTVYVRACSGATCAYASVAP
jgi:hypothetical protein